MLTKLEAVNIALEAINEEPVSSLASGLPDAEDAERILDRVSKEVQAKGWHVNTSYDVKMYPNANSYIVVSDDMLRVDTTGQHKYINVTVRDVPGQNIRGLYNIDDQLFAWTHEYLLCDIVYLFEFTALNFELQSYIAHKAAREFQESVMGSTSLDSFTTRKELEAYLALSDYEAEMSDSNVLQDSTHARFIAYRYNRIWGT